MKYPTIFNFKNDIATLNSQVANLKKTILEIEVIGVSTKKHELQSLVNSIDAILRRWDDIGKDITNQLRGLRIPPNARITTIAYNFVKDYIYSKYDYSSLLSFIDGLVDGLNDGIITSSSKIDDFFANTVRLAFRTPDSSSAEIVDTVLSICSNECVEMDGLEQNLFDNIRSYREMFSPADRGVIYNSIRSAIDDIGHTYNSIKIYSHYLKIQALSQIMDYIALVVTVFMSKAFIISYYVAPVIEAANTEPDDSNDDEDDEEYSEATIDTSVCEFEPLRTYALSDLRDIRKTSKFFDLVKDYITWLNISVDTKLLDRSSADSFERIPFVVKSNILNTVIYNTITSPTYISTSQNTVTPILQLEELRHNLGEALTNPSHALANKVPDKNSILHVVRSATYGNDIQSLHKLLVDLCIFGKYLNLQIIHVLNNISSVTIETSDKKPLPASLHDQKVANECYHMLLKFHRDLMFAIYRKVINISDQLSAHSHNAISNVNKITSLNTIDIIRAVNPSSTLEDDMMAAVPTTMRVPLISISSVSPFELDSFSIPIYERLELYDDYLRSLPEFRNDPYLTEAAGDIAKLINALIALIQGAINSTLAFFTKNFRPAAEWVIAHEQDLLKLTFNHIEGGFKDIRPYNIQFDIFKTTIQNLIAAGEKINPNEENEKLDELLYTGEAKIIATNKDDGLKIYRNKILYNQPKAEDIPTKVLPNHESITAELAIWIKDIKAADLISTNLNTMGKSLVAMINKLKATTVTSTGNQTETKTPPKPDDQKNENNKNEDNKSKEEEPKLAKEPQRNDTPTSPSAKVITEVQRAIDQQWLGINKEMLTVMREEYSYIKFAYQHGKKA